MSALKIAKELVPYTSIVRSTEDPWTWVFDIKGPAGSLYEGGTFRVSFKYPCDYPFRRPHVYFITPIHHPNVHFTGDKGLVYLKHLYNWSPSTDTARLLQDLNELLIEPDVTEHYVPDLARQYRDHREDFETQARAKMMASSI